MLRALASALLFVTLGLAEVAALEADLGCEDQCEGESSCPATAPCDCTCCVHLPATLSARFEAVVLAAPSSRVARAPHQERSPLPPDPREILVVPRAS